MKMRLSYPSLAWAVRDTFRQPLEALLLFLALASLALVLGTVLLLGQTLAGTTERLLKNAPSLVVRRVSPGGWAPMPAEDAVRIAKSVPGVIGVRSRIWGTVAGPAGPVTVYGIERLSPQDGFPEHINQPSVGHAILGPGVPVKRDTDVIKLSGVNDRVLKVAAVLDSRMSIVINDLILLHPQDARYILGIQPGYVSDVAVDVFHENEAEALLPDLTKAYPWPVRLIPRREAAGIYSSGLARRSGLAYMTLVPALLALAYIVIGTLKHQHARRYEVGLYKSFGWTTLEIFRLQLLKALTIGLPAVVCGLAVAYASVLWPGVAWPGYLFLGWKNQPPLLYLDTSGAVLVLLEVFLLVCLPYLTAAIWPALKAATADPQEILERETF